MTKYAYDYQNQHTRGWVRAEFDVMPASQGWAGTLLQETAGQWANGTDLRLVQLADDNTETFPAVTAKGSRGPMPHDKKDV